MHRPLEGAADAVMVISRVRPRLVIDLGDPGQSEVERRQLRVRTASRDGGGGAAFARVAEQGGTPCLHLREILVDRDAFCGRRRETLEPLGQGVLRHEARQSRMRPFLLKEVAGCDSLLAVVDCVDAGPDSVFPKSDYKPAKRILGRVVSPIGHAAVPLSGTDTRVAGIVVAGLSLRRVVVRRELALVGGAAQVETLATCARIQ